ncbi:MAG: hypothetical protein QOJ20_5547, partial [Mycobacterium sp.]|nr:hypothetical protein [Mycobacterium sp.]
MSGGELSAHTQQMSVRARGTLVGVVALCEAGTDEIVDPGWSDRQGELVEGSQDPKVCFFFGPEF